MCTAGHIREPETQRKKNPSSIERVGTVPLLTINHTKGLEGNKASLLHCQ